MNALLQLLIREEVVTRLIDLMYTIKKDANNEKIPRNLCSLRQKETMDIDPLVDLDIDNYCISKVILDFGSQANIMTRATWERLGHP